MHPRRNRLQLPLGESKWWHPAGRSVFDQVSNLSFAAASQAAAVDQRRGPIPAFSTLAVASLTELLELLFGLAEIDTLSSRNLGTSLNCCQSGRTSERDVRRPLPHWSHRTGATAFNSHMAEPFWEHDIKRYPVCWRRNMPLATAETSIGHVPAEYFEA